MKTPEQIFINHIEIKFQIRKSNISSAPALIYGIFTLQNHTYRISTLLKVYPNQWKQHKQRCLISPRLDTLSNKNNAIANRRLNEIEEAFNEKILELSNNTLDADVIKTELIHVINIKHKSRMAKKINGNPDVTEQMKSFFSQEKKGLKDSCITEYNGLVKVFQSFLKEKNIPNQWNYMTYDTWKSFYEWLIDNKGNNRGSKVLRMTIKWLFEIEDSNVKKGGIILDRRIKELKIKESGSPENYAPLNLFEIRKIYDLTDEEILGFVKPSELAKIKVHKDLFVLQCLTGVRVSDLHKVTKENFVEVQEDKPFFKFLPEKNTNKDKPKLALIPFSIFDSIENVRGLITVLYSRLKDNIDALDKTEQKKYNNNIKILCRAGGLNRTVLFKQGKKDPTQEKICDIITSHDGRHSFVTNCRWVLKIPADNVIILTGHTDTQYIQKVYDNPTDEQKIKSIFDIIEKGNEHNVIEKFIVNPYPELPESIEEYKEVLEFLGVDPREYIGINDMSSLLRVYVLFEKEILDSCEGKLDIKKIKEIFNVDAPLTKRKKDLEYLRQILKPSKKKKLKR